MHEHGCHALMNLSSPGDAVADAARKASAIAKGKLRPTQRSHYHQLNSLLETAIENDHQSINEHSKSIICSDLQTRTYPIERYIKLWKGKLSDIGVSGDAIIEQRCVESSLYKPDDCDYVIPITGSTVNGAMAVGVGGGVSASLMALGLYGGSSARIEHWVCETFFHIAAHGGTKTREILIRAGVVPELVRSVQGRLGDGSKRPLVQEAAIRATWALLVEGDEAIIDQFLEESAHIAIGKTLKVHVAKLDIQLHGCACLGLLGVGRATRKRAAATQLLAIIDAMKYHPDNASLQAVGCGTIWTLSSGLSDQPGSERGVGDADDRAIPIGYTSGIELACAARRRFPKNESVQTSTEGLLRALIHRLPLKEIQTLAIREALMSAVAPRRLQTELEQLAMSAAGEVLEGTLRYLLWLTQLPLRRCHHYRAVGRGVIRTGPQLESSKAPGFLEIGEEIDVRHLPAVA